MNKGIEKMNKEIEKEYILACQYDEIPINAMFKVFSINNPYIIKYMKLLEKSGPRRGSQFYPAVV